MDTKTQAGEQFLHKYMAYFLGHNIWVLQQIPPWKERKNDCWQQKFIAPQTDSYHLCVIATRGIALLVSGQLSITDRGTEKSMRVVKLLNPSPWYLGHFWDISSHLQHSAFHILLLLMCVCACMLSEDIQHIVMPISNFLWLHAVDMNKNEKHGACVCVCVCWIDIWGVCAC